MILMAAQGRSAAINLFRLIAFFIFWEISSDFPENKKSSARMHTQMQKEYVASVFAAQKCAL